MRNIKMGLKLGIGFGLVLLVMGVLSLLAIRAMNEQEQNARNIDEIYVAELALGVRIERAAWGAMSSMLRYQYSEDPVEAQNAQREVDEIKSQVVVAQALITKYPHLQRLRGYLNEGNAVLSAYEELVKRTVTLQEALKQRREILIRTGENAMTNLTKVIATQEERIQSDLEAGNLMEVERRLKNFTDLNTVLDLFAAVRMANFQSQVLKDPAIAERALGNFLPIMTLLPELIEKYRRPDTKAALTEVSRNAEAYKAEFTQLINEWKAIRSATDERTAKVTALLDAARKTAQVGLEEVTSLCDAAVTSAAAAKSTLVMGIVVGLVIGIILTVLLTRAITGPLRKSVEYAQVVAGGNLDHVLDIHQKDEVGQLADSLNAMVDTLRGRIAEAQEATAEASAKQKEAVAAMQEADEARRQAEQAKRQGMLDAAGQLEEVVAAVSSASEQLSAQVEQSERGSQEQAARVGETATAMEEMNATVLEVAKNAGETADVSESAKQKAQVGADIVQQVIGGMGRISKSSVELRNDMADLSNKAASIGTIMNVISDIADQTNLLALNAAIEAARAGEAGRGFAVVADEVRKLAEKTMKATSEVGEAIQGIQQGTAKNVSNVEGTATIVNEVMDLASRSGEALGEIVTLVDHASDQVRAIATASEEQSATSEEINRAVEDISRISSETAEAMRQSGEAVVELSRQAHVLKDLINTMKNA